HTRCYRDWSSDVCSSDLDRVQPGMRLAQDEIFGPVLTVMRTEDLGEAIARANQSPYGNGAVIFTRDGGVARRFTREIQCGMVGKIGRASCRERGVVWAGW